VCDAHIRFVCPLCVAVCVAMCVAMCVAVCVAVFDVDDVA